MTSSEQNDWLNDVVRMRWEFDQLFAAPEPPPAPESDDFLAIRTGSQPFALRVSELAWIEAHRKVVALPSSHPSLLGLVNARGQLVPVYTLELLLGLPATPVAKPWIAIHDRSTPFGLAFEVLERYIRLPCGEVLGHSSETQPGHTRQALRVAGEIWPVIHLPALLAVVRERTGGVVAQAGLSHA